MRQLSHHAIADACLNVAEELVAQPSLFDANLLPVDVPVLRAAKRLASTGQITAKDEAVALGVAACKLAGLSDRQTGKQLGISHTTVKGVMRLLEASGRIPSTCDRLAGRLGELAESATEEIGRLITAADGDWSSKSAGAVRALGIAVGIAVDKHQLLTGQATQIVEQRAGGPAADAVKQWEDKLREMFRPVIDISAGPSDSASVDLVPNQLIDKPNRLLATPLATSSSPNDLGAGGGSATRPAATAARGSIE
jgi:hypothetical protein